MLAFKPPGCLMYSQMSSPLKPSGCSTEVLSAKTPSPSSVVELSCMVSGEEVEGNRRQRTVSTNQNKTDIKLIRALFI